MTAHASNRSDVEIADGYRRTLDGVFVIATMVETLELDLALDVARIADAFAPILLPSEWIRGNQNIQDARALLVPLVAFREAARIIRDRARAATGAK